MPTVSSLFIYPVKSAQGVSLSQMQIETRGPRDDRRWMVVDEQGHFITQRENRKLATISPSLEDERWVVRAPDQPALSLETPSSSRVPIRIWSFQGEALDKGDECANWFSAVLEQPCRLVEFAPDVRRPVSQEYTSLDAEVRFPDGYPLLVLSLESLTELNRRLEVPLPMNRFRPNIVLRGCQPFEEDECRALGFPDARVDLVKPCIRCKITTIDQRTLQLGKEPLRTLARFRKSDRGVLFAQNGIHHGPGTISVGDTVTLIRDPSRRPKF